MNTAITIQFTNQRRRQWVVRFDLGSEHANSIAALAYAWRHNAVSIKTL